MTGGPLPWSLDEPPATVCLVRLSAIGDVVLTLPLAAALKKAWPEAKLTWVTQPLPATLLEGSPAVDEVLLFRRLRGLDAVREYRRFRTGVQGRRFDLVLTPQVALKAGILTRLIRAEARVGFDRQRASDLQWLFTTHRIPSGPRRHVVDETLEFATALGIEPRPLRWPLRLSPAEQEARDRFFGNLDAPACGVVVGTSDPRKNWPAERWAPVIDAIEERFGLRVLLLGGPSSAERATADRVLERCRTDPEDHLGDDLRRLMWLLDGCRLVVAPDTGPLHIAVALGTPVVGLYGRTNPDVTGPYGASRAFVVDGYARHEEEDYGTSRKYRSGGMERVAPRAVLQKVEEALESGSDEGGVRDGLSGEAGERGGRGT